MLKLGFMMYLLLHGNSKMFGTTKTKLAIQTEKHYIWTYLCLSKEKISGTKLIELNRKQQ